MIVHRIWCGPPIPDDYAEYAAAWQELNPGWRVDTWTEERIRDTAWVNQTVVDHLYPRGRSPEMFTQLADVLGYELARQGLYVNCDIQPVRPLGDLADEAWVVREDDRWIVNAAMQGPHQVFDRTVEALPASYFADPLAPMNQTTGPHLLTRIVAEVGGIRVLPPAVFNPTHWNKIRKGGTAAGLRYPAETVAVHHWGHRRTGRKNTY